MCDSNTVSHFAEWGVDLIRTLVSLVEITATRRRQRHKLIKDNNSDNQINKQEVPTRKTIKINTATKNNGICMN